MFTHEYLQGLTAFRKRAIDSWVAQQLDAGEALDLTAKVSFVGAHAARPLKIWIIVAYLGICALLRALQELSAAIYLIMVGLLVLICLIVYSPELYGFIFRTWLLAVTPRGVLWFRCRGFWGPLSCDDGGFLPIEEIAGARNMVSVRIPGVLIKARDGSFLQVWGAKPCCNEIRRLLSDLAGK